MWPHEASRRQWLHDGHALLVSGSPIPSPVSILTRYNRCLFHHIQHSPRDGAEIGHGDSTEGERHHAGCCPQCRTQSCGGRALPVACIPRCTHVKTSVLRTTEYKWATRRIGALVSSRKYRDPSEFCTLAREGCGCCITRRTVAKDIRGRADASAVNNTAFHAGR